MGSRPLGPWKISPRRHTRALAALARSWPRHSLPTAEGAEPGGLGTEWDRGQRCSPFGRFRGIQNCEARTHPIARPFRLRHAPGSGAFRDPPLAGPEGPGRPLQITGHIRRPRFLSAVVTEGQSQ